MNTDTEKWIYKNNCKEDIRYVLGTKGDNPLICFGVNPSTATPDTLDNTIKSVERLTLYNNFDSWIMLNLYPQRSTLINNLDKTLSIEKHKNNLDSIEELLTTIKSPTIWAAWGTLIRKRPYLTECLSDIYSISSKYNCNWITIGKKSKAEGHPHHPLYLNSKTTKEHFDIVGYLKKYVA